MFPRARQLSLDTHDMRLTNYRCIKVPFDEVHTPSYMRLNKPPQPVEKVLDELILMKERIASGCWKSIQRFCLQMSKAIGLSDEDLVIMTV